MHQDVSSETREMLGRDLDLPWPLLRAPDRRALVEICERLLGELGPTNEAVEVPPCPKCESKPEGFDTCPACHGAGLVSGALKYPLGWFLRKREQKTRRRKIPGYGFEAGDPGFDEFKERVVHPEYRQTRRLVPVTIKVGVDPRDREARDEEEREDRA